MSNDARLLIAQAKAARFRKSGAFAKPKKNKIKNWMTTRQLVNAVESRLTEFGSCRINGKWNLQIRGKHMRRLKKKLNVRQEGRYVVWNE
jgi:hypothetical protein